MATIFWGLAAVQRQYSSRWWKCRRFKGALGYGWTGAEKIKLVVEQLVMVHDSWDLKLKTTWQMGGPNSRKECLTTSDEVGKSLREKSSNVCESELERIWIRSFDKFLIGPTRKVPLSRHY